MSGSLVNEPTPDHCRSRETASYIADMARELASLANERELAILRYLLQMASEEARSIAALPALSGGGTEVGAQDEGS